MSKYKSKVESKSTDSNQSDRLSADYVANNLEKITLEDPRVETAKGQPGIKFKTGRFKFGDKSLMWYSTEVSTFPVKMPTNQSYQSQTPSTQVTWDWDKNKPDLMILMYAALLATKTIGRIKSSPPTEYEALKEAYFEQFPTKDEDDDDFDSGKLRGPIFTFYAKNKQANISISKFKLYESKNEGTRSSTSLRQDSGQSIPISWEKLIGRRGPAIVQMQITHLYLGGAVKCLRLSSKQVLIIKLFEHESPDEFHRKGLEKEAIRQNLGGMSKEAVAAVIGNLGRSEVVSAQKPSVTSPGSETTVESLDQGQLVSDDDNIEPVLADLNDDDNLTPEQELSGTKAKRSTKHR